VDDTPAMPPTTESSPLGEQPRSPTSRDFSNWNEIIAHSQRVRWLELLVLLLLVILSDAAIYQARGYAGPAVYLGMAPLLMACGAVRRCWNWQTILVLIMVWGIAGRLLWCGSWLAVAGGFIFLGAVSLSLAGGSVFILEMCRFIAGMFFSSFCGLLVYERWLRQLLGRWLRVPSLARWLQFLLPPAVGLVFAVVFILANPDLARWTTNEIAALIRQVDEWLIALIDSPWRIVFWIASLCVSIGLLRPLLMSVPVLKERADASPPVPAEAPLYPAFRNTLGLLMILFAAYLCFEFWTMWKGDFPPDFYYAGYAHEGAFWLTVALGLATVLLSLFFRGTMWTDSRLPNLKRLAFIWSAENLLLAAAVYNRLFIYIHFNGMTRMRVIGMLGTSTVVVGLLLVVLKILLQRNFAWVIRHQLIALAVAIYLYAVLPVDAFVVRYDVAHILSGNLKPSVQIAHHPTSLEGKIMLFPLLECPDPIIRDGIAEMLWQTRQDLDQQTTGDWTTWQAAADLFRKMADRNKLHEPRQLPPPGAWQRLRDYSFQWY